MRNKAPWYFHPPDEPKKQRGDDSLGVLVGVLLVLIVIFVALDHALFHILTVISAWADTIGYWLPG